MKVLFAMGDSLKSKKVAEKYYEKYGEELEYKDVFFFKSLLEEVKSNKTYDRIVVREELEEFLIRNVESLDKFIFSKIDSLTDETEDAEIIFICSDRRSKQNDPFVEKLFSIGVYNILIGDERRFEPLCDYIKKPLNKKEAKRHLNITSVMSSGNFTPNDDTVEEVQIMHILKYYDTIKGNIAEYVPAFDRIAEQYSRNQLKVIIPFLPNDVKREIFNSEKYVYLIDDAPQNASNVSNKPNIIINRPAKKGLFGILKENKSKEKVNPQPNVIVEEQDNAQKEELARKKAELQAKQEEIERNQQELKARAEREAKAKEQAELMAKAKQEMIEKEQRENSQKFGQEVKTNNMQNNLTDDDIQVDVLNSVNRANVNNEQENLKARAEQEAKAREEAMLKAKAEQENKRNMEQEKYELERKKLEQERIALEEEKRKLREQSEQLSRENIAIAKQEDAYNRYETSNSETKKMAVFVGSNKSGTTFIVNAVAHSLANSKIGVGVLDMTRDKSLYYIYNQNDKGLMRIASECMQKLSEGVDAHMPIKKNLKVYTTIPGSSADVRRTYKNRAIIDTLRDNNNVVIVDADFSTPLEYFEKADEIYIVQDLDLMKLQETTSFLRELKGRSVNMDKVRVIINKYVKSSLTSKKLLEGLSYYNDPQMSFVEELLSGKVLSFVVPFNVENYTNYINALCNYNLDYKKYTPDFLEVINEISSNVYRGNNIKKRKGLFS